MRVRLTQEDVTLFESVVYMFDNHPNSVVVNQGLALRYADVCARLAVWGYRRTILLINCT